MTRIIIIFFIISLILGAGLIYDLYKFQKNCEKFRENVGKTTKEMKSDCIKIDSLYQELNKIQKIKINRAMMTHLKINPSYYVFTSYSPTIAQTDSTPFITANGDSVFEGGVAVSRNLLINGWKFGKRIYVIRENWQDEVLTINDVMHRKKLNQFDKFDFNNLNALIFGRQRLRVFLIG